MKRKVTENNDEYLAWGQTIEIADKHGLKPKTIRNIAYRLRCGHKYFRGKGRKASKTILSTLKKNKQNREKSGTFLDEK